MEEISKNQIIEVLSKIMDLSRGKDIYNAGNVTDIAIKDNNVQVTLEVESHRAKAFEVIRKEAEKAINKIPKVTNGIVILTSHSVKSSSKSINEAVDKKDNKNSITYWLNLLQNLKCNEDIFLTLNPYFDIDKTKVLKKLCNIAMFLYFCH